MNELILITPPAAEPVLVPEMMVQLGLGSPSDTALNAQLTQQLTGLLLAARQYCENYTRTSFMTQTWLLQRDGWPEVDSRYHIGGAFHAAFRIPKPPFQSIAFAQYVDTDGTIQPLLWNQDYGASASLTFGYQLDPGGNDKPARMMPPWARPWPPIRQVANAIMIQFKCGYGGPVTATMALNSAILTGPVFNPGDVGQPISVPGASVGPVDLRTTILSVDVNGEATLVAPATVAVTGVTAYVGQQVPESVRQAIKFMAQYFFQSGVDVDLPTPRIIAELLEMYRNRVS